MNDNKCFINTCKKIKMWNIDFCYIHKNRKIDLYIKYEIKRIIYMDDKNNINIKKYFEGCDDEYCLFCNDKLINKWY